LELQSHHGATIYRVRELTIDFTDLPSFGKFQLLKNRDWNQGCLLFDVGKLLEVVLGRRRNSMRIINQSFYLLFNLRAWLLFRAARRGCLRLRVGLELKEMLAILGSHQLLLSLPQMIEMLIHILPVIVESPLVGYLILWLSGPSSLDSRHLVAVQIVHLARWVSFDFSLLLH
jgi:hypothetical protein